MVLGNSRSASETRRRAHPCPASAPPGGAGCRGGPGRGGREMPLCPAGAVSSSRKQGRRPEQARRSPPAPPPTAPWPCPRLCPLCCCRWFLGCRGWGGVRDTCASSPSLAGFRSPLRRPPARQPSSAPACRDPRAWCAEAPLVSVCPARFVRLRLGREATTALSRHCLWLALALALAQPDSARCHQGSSLLLASTVSLMAAAGDATRVGTLVTERMGGSRPHWGLLLCPHWVPHRLAHRLSITEFLLAVVAGFAPVTRRQRATQVQLPGEKGLGGRPRPAAPSSDPQQPLCSCVVRTGRKLLLA